MNIIAVSLFGIAGALLSVFASKAGSEYGFCVSVFCSAAIVIYIIPDIGVLLSSLSEYSLPESAKSGFECLFKAVGAGYTAQLASDICHDSGHDTVASNIRLAGKISIIIITVPVIKELFGAIASSL